MTSVKRFRIHEEPTRSSPGTGSFVFTDAYSVFDWGRMPDDIPQKGRTLCAMGAGTFESLEAAGIDTHYRGVGDVADPLALADCSEPPREMAIDLTRVPDLPFRDGGYDYEAFYDAVGSHYLVPLEIVFRNRVPVGSSLRTRTRPRDHGLSLETWPEETVELADPIVEFSTKFEESDRYLEMDEANEIAGPASIDALREVAERVNEVVTRRAATAGLTHLDGKIECLYRDGEILVADVTGTLDENRFAYDGRQLSKEVLRQYYARTDAEWAEAVSAAKDRAHAEGVADWRPLCERSPEPLPSNVLNLASAMYRSAANAYLDRSLFEAPGLDEVAVQLDALGE